MNNQPTNKDLMDTMLRMDSKIDTVYRKLDEKIDGVRNDLTARIDGVTKDLTAKIDGVYKKLDQKIDHQIDLTGRIINEFANDMTKRVVKLELARA